MEIRTLIAIMASVAMAACSSSNQASAGEQGAERSVAVPQFDADTAYAYVAAQTAYGPRVPGTAASRECAQWLSSQLQRLGASDISCQQAQVTAYNGDILDICNISASLHPQLKRRILLMAHWDSRPWADAEKDASLRHQPIDGANDGASGVAVILEIARQLQTANPRLGVDILFSDAEDYGRHADEASEIGDEDTWCLGTQYWLEHPTLDLKQIRYAVLLDMVGGKDALFPREYFSDYGASDVVDAVWKAAKAAGYGARFPDSEGGAVVDDHLYMLRAGIPAIDIIESQNPQTGSFNPTWHTRYDNISNIDRSSLKAVGQTLLQLIMTN